MLRSWGGLRSNPSSPATCLPGAPEEGRPLTRWDLGTQAETNRRAVLRQGPPVETDSQRGWLARQAEQVKAHCVSSPADHRIPTPHSPSYIPRLQRPPPPRLLLPRHRISQPPRWLDPSTNGQQRRLRARFHDDHGLKLPGISHGSMLMSPVAAAAPQCAPATRPHLAHVHC